MKRKYFAVRYWVICNLSCILSFLFLFVFMGIVGIFCVFVVIGVVC